MAENENKKKFVPSVTYSNSANISLYFPVNDMVLLLTTDKEVNYIKIFVTVQKILMIECTEPKTKMTV